VFDTWVDCCPAPRGPRGDSDPTEYIDIRGFAMSAEVVHDVLVYQSV
jgi:hypothetical protein